MLSHVSLLAASLPTWVTDYAVWWVAGIIVVGGLLFFGIEDVVHVRWRRIWAISGVSFAESLRRKVLWVTPLAILGVIAVSWLQHALDPQEAIRQTIKFCLFASGLLVTITAIILACTNLPREIENRVIYTIVTKPTNRLEIVLGKIIGFIRVSGLIVLIMGAFTFIFLAIQNHSLNSQIAERLKTESDPATRQTLEGYQTAGLLSTRSLAQPAQFEVFEQAPDNSGIQWL
ncbi:MAG TPA: ABC transporter permease, partial [Tepidisphaeraceae bacterium]|nr:ABC transporter permease [Tepidisphaeraceae bacterium]